VNAEAQILATDPAHNNKPIGSTEGIYGRVHYAANQRYQRAARAEWQLQFQHGG
jgi:hypothetical protein